MQFVLQCIHFMYLHPQTVNSSCNLSLNSNQIVKGWREIGKLKRDNLKNLQKEFLQKKKQLTKLFSKYSHATYSYQYPKQ